MRDRAHLYEGGDWAGPSEVFNELPAQWNLTARPAVRLRVIHRREFERLMDIHLGTSQGASRQKLNPGLKVLKAEGLMTVHFSSVIVRSGAVIRAISSRDRRERLSAPGYGQLSPVTV